MFAMHLAAYTASLLMVSLHVADGHQMRLRDYISMTTTQLAADHDSAESANQHLGTVHTEAAFLAKFAPTSADETAALLANVSALSPAHRTQP